MDEPMDRSNLNEVSLMSSLSRRALLGLAAAGAASAALGSGARAGQPSMGNNRLTASAQGESGGQVSVGYLKPVTLNPLFSTIGYEQVVEQLIFGSLVKVNAKLEAVPDIATAIDVSEDATTYTFKLNPNLTFTDGQPLTAKDVVFTIERAIDARTGSYWQGRLMAIEGAAEYSEQAAETISGLETPDDFTVVMRLAAPDSTWLLTLGDFAGLGILPKHILEGIAPDQMKQHSFSLEPNVTAGVFTYAKYETDQYIELVRNENYGGEKAKLDRVFFKILTADVTVAQLETGELDVANIPVTEMERLSGNPDLTVVSVPSPSIDFLAVNITKPHLADKRIRQAMMYAIDREAIVQAIFAGEASVVNQTIIGPEWMGSLELNPYSFDPDKARQLLSDAGWDSSQKIELDYVPGTKTRDAYAPIIQQLFKDVGIEIELMPLESAEYTRRRNTDHVFDMAIVGGGVFRQDPNVSSKYFETKNFVPGGANYSHFSNARVDELFAAGRATTNQEERKAIYTEIATILNEEVPWIYLWSPNSIFAHNNRLVGFDPPSYVNTPMWNADKWTVTS
jgi:peptide/nickel transport system substrate-binding protein